MWYVILLVSTFLLSQAYETRMDEYLDRPLTARTNEECSIIGFSNKTTLKHTGGWSVQTNTTSHIMAVNNQCDLVLFGYPQQNKVVMWYPYHGIEINIRPDFNVQVERFGFALDIRNQTWVVGAPGRPNNNLGENASYGYAFVYEGTQLHSCRSIYDTYCFKVDETCETGYKAMKDNYNLSDASVPSFQKQCVVAGTPNHLTESFIFPSQQFGFDVVLTGPLDGASTGLFVSAPGDTNRFMEDNQGQNIGQVFTWKSVLAVPEQNIVWWQMTSNSPISAPDLAGATYRAYGRSISATEKNLVVGSYPLYDVTREPFVYVYDCENAYCVPTPNIGISINNLPGNVLGYLTPAELSYTDGKSQQYIAADVEGDQLGDFQNAFIGNSVHIVGSNILIPDVINGKVYRAALTSEMRESHSFNGVFGTSEGSEQWVHGLRLSENTLKRLYPCVPGYVGQADVCQPCPLNTAQEDGWEIVCDICPRNFTANNTGMVKCRPRSSVTQPGMSDEDAYFIIGGIVVISIAMYGLFVACECLSNKRTTRRFVDTKV